MVIFNEGKQPMIFTLKTQFKLQAFNSGMGRYEWDINHRLMHDARVRANAEQFWQIFTAHAPCDTWDNFGAKAEAGQIALMDAQRKAAITSMVRA